MIRAWVCLLFHVRRVRWPGGRRVCLRCEPARAEECWPDVIREILSRPAWVVRPYSVWSKEYAAEERRKLDELRAAGVPV